MSPRSTARILAFVLLLLAARTGVNGCSGGALSAGIAAAAPQATRRVEKAPTGHPTPLRSQPKRAPFLPSRHGFAFTNSFRGSPLPGELGALGSALSRSLGLPSDFGLCGGMCFTAADNYFADRAPPPDTTPPASGTALYSRLYARQSDSLAPGLSQATRFAEWMALDDTGPDGTRARTFAELGPIVERLGRAQLVHLGLVHVSFRETHELWRNHQVLAYGVVRPEPGVVDLRVYDPNYPKRDDIAVRLRVKRLEPASALRIGLAFHAPPALGVEGSLIATDGTILKTVRGLFAMPYTPSR